MSQVPMSMESDAGKPGGGDSGGTHTQLLLKKVSDKDEVNERHYVLLFRGYKNFISVKKKIALVGTRPSGT